MGHVAVVILVLPLAFRQGFALSLLSQMGIAIIFALSYNMLLGQTGLLSFGHAVYLGLGAFVAPRAEPDRAGQACHPGHPAAAGGWARRALFGVLFGYVTTRQAGTRSR